MSSRSRCPSPRSRWSATHSANPPPRSGCPTSPIEEPIRGPRHASPSHGPTPSKTPSRDPNADAPPRATITAATAAAAEAEDRIGRRSRRGQRRARLRRLTPIVPAGQGTGDGFTPNVAEYGSMSDHLHRRDIWGDDPEERDASEVVAEIAAVEPEVGATVARPPRRRSASRSSAASSRGTAVGSPSRSSASSCSWPASRLLVLPGPGWLLIFVGLSILGTEYVWAQRMLRIAKEQANKAKDKVLRRKQAKADRRDGTSVRRLRRVLIRR